MISQVCIVTKQTIFENRQLNKHQGTTIIFLFLFKFLSKQTFFIKDFVKEVKHPRSKRNDCGFKHLTKYDVKQAIPVILGF